MDQEIRNKLRNVVTQCRRLLEDDTRDALEGKFGIFAKKDQVTADPSAKMTHLSDEEQAARKDILDHYAHIKARGFKPKETLDQLIREIAFTHLNRLCAYKMMEAREVYVGGQKFRESVSRSVNSNGVKFYLAEHEDDERLFNTGHQDVAYRHFLDWLGGLLSEEIGVLFNPNDPANRLYPRQKTLDEVLDLLNGGGIKPEETELRSAWPLIWSQDETIGWVYQYFTPKELRDQARKESQAPRNSYELAFRNQFFTPRYVVEFLTDNTLGRIWHEMRKGETKLKEQCRYLVRRPDEVFLSAAAAPGHEHFSDGSGEIARRLQEAGETEFPLFSAADDAAVQQLIDLAHCVNGYETKGDDSHEWFSAAGERIERGDFSGISTQDLLDYLFFICRADRHGGDGRIYSAPWFAAVANEVRRRALSARAEDASQEQLLRAPVFIPYRPKKDPRDLKILDPACGSGHFLLYCFDLLLTIYEEAYADSDLGPVLKKDYPTLDALQRDVPRLVLAHNLHGIDIDLRASQIAALALWLRCQRAYQEMGLKKDRPKITRSNFVCAEPMPGEEQMLKEFVGQLEPIVLGQLVEVVFDKMKLAGEAGSLLKIEEEIRDAVAAAKKQWEAGPISFQLSLFERAPPTPVQRRFNLSDITNEQFFEKAEARAIEALRSYAEKAQNGQRLQRRLFSEDAVRGFAFVDLCQKRYDVVLMNPPFGVFSKQCKEFAHEAYPNSYNDLLCAFTERYLQQLGENGYLGAITSRTPFFISSASSWRNGFLLSRSCVVAMTDLGEGVMDDAMVESAAFILSSWAVTSEIPFIRMLGLTERHHSLRNEITAIISGVTGPRTFFRKASSFSTIPDAPFAYWVASQLALKLCSFEPFEPTVAQIRVGLTTLDNPRFVRTLWEVPPSQLGVDGDFSPDALSTWAPLVIGGKSQPWFSPIQVCVLWGSNGTQLREYIRTRGSESRWIRSPEFYFRPGFSWTRRAVRFIPYAIPRGCIPTASRYMAYPKNGFEISAIGVSASNVASAFLRFYGEKFAYPNYLVDNVKSLPWPHLSPTLEERLKVVVEGEVERRRCVYRNHEPFQEFVLPSLIKDYSVGTAVTSDLASFLGTDLELDVAAAYGLESNEYSTMISDLCEALASTDDVPARANGGDDEDGQGEGYDDILSDTDASRYEAVLSYCVGVTVGRWDVRMALDPSLVPKLSGPFDCIPMCPPGSLVSPDGLPAIIGGIVSTAWLMARPNTASLPSGHLAQAVIDAEEYPVSINWDGICVDDQEHKQDVIRRVRDVGEAIWGDRSDAIEKEACKALGVKELRDYFRKPSKGGFWDDHIFRYSKSRRKAPIYWLLQSSKKNYALWLYYHRLDKDLLFKALVNYVEPKIRLETSRLDSLRSQKAAAGDSGKEAKRVAKDVERQEDFLSELRDFEDKLRRAANLHLEPDLNDGVVLNIAPLWELAPWKEAKKYWDELMEGKYEWSSIGKQLRQKGLVHP